MIFRFWLNYQRPAICLWHSIRHGLYVTETDWSDVCWLQWVVSISSCKTREWQRVLRKLVEAPGSNSRLNVVSRGNCWLNRLSCCWTARCLCFVELNWAVAAVPSDSLEFSKYRRMERRGRYWSCCLSRARELRTLPSCWAELSGIWARPRSLPLVWRVRDQSRLYSYLDVVVCRVHGLIRLFYDPSSRARTNWSSVLWDKRFVTARQQKRHSYATKRLSHAERCTSYSKSVRPSVCLSVRHTMALCQNDSSYDHAVFMVG